ncbi:MAG TPA: Ig-like domain-containing protein, partial [Thermoanaerobaculia bacterium]
AGVADFHLAPSAQATTVMLRDGIERVRIVDYPGRIDRGSLVGAEGGRVPGDGSVTIDIPAGATTEALHATTSALDPASFGTIAGFRIAGAFTLSLSNANDATRESSLILPARATFAVTGTVAHEVIVAQVIGDSPFGVLYKLVAIADRNGTLFTTRAIDSTQLPLDGLVRGGQYVILAADNPIAFAFGQVRSESNLAIANARVTSGFGVTSLTPLSGVFVLPVPARPAAPFSLVARSIATGDGAAKSASTAPDAGAFVDFGVLPLVTQPPQLRSVTPDGGEVAVSTNLAVLAEFDRAIDASSIANGIRVTNMLTSTDLAGVVSVAGSNVSFVASEPLRAGSVYTITIASSIRSTTGAAFGQTVVKSFRTPALPSGNTSIRPDRIRITIPDANGRSTIRGTAGALPPNAQAVAVRRGRYFVNVYQATVAADGAFSFDAGHGTASDRITITDRIDLQVIDPVSHAIVAMIELTPFSSADGRSFIAMPDRVSRFVSADGIAVTVPSGAFDTPTTIAVIPSAASAFADVPSFNTELAYATSVELQFEGIAKQRLELELPIPAGTDTSRTWLLGWLGQSMRGPRVMITDLLYANAGVFKTGIAASSNARVMTNARVAANAFTLGEVRESLMGATQSGTYGVVNVLAPGGSDMVWGLLDDISASADVFWDSLISLFASRQYVEDRSRIAIPLLTNVPFRIYGVDAATGLEAFSRTYSPIPPGDAGAPLGLANPNPDRIGPYPVFGSPFRVETLEVAAAGITYSSIRDFDIELVNGTIYAYTNTLPPTRRITLMNVTRGLVDRTRLGGLSVAGEPGDRIALLIEELDVDPTLPLSIVFSEPIDATNLPNLIRVEVEIDGEYRQLTNALTLRLDSGDHRVIVETPASLQRGKRYRVVLDPQLADGSGLHIGEARDADGAQLGTPLDEPLYLDFTVREPGGQIAEFELASGRIRDQALNGNVLFVSAMEGGITAYDVADPANPAVTGATLPDGVEYWALATDHHGRVYATGTQDLWGILRTFRVDDFLPRLSGNPGRAEPRGNALLTWVPGSAAILGLNSRALEDGRPESLPRKVQILVQDSEVAYASREEFIEGESAANTGTEGEFGVYRVEVPRDPALPYATQRITIVNVTLDLRWSGDATTSQPAI